MLRNWRWIHWTVLAGYYAAVFILSRGLYTLTYVLGFLPLILIFVIVRTIYKEMVYYLTYNHAEAWGKISRDRLEAYWYQRSILSFDGEIDDPNYIELRNEFRRVYRAFYFSNIALIVSCIFSVVTAAK